MKLGSHWEEVQWEAQQWPIYLRYFGWDMRNCAVFHTVQILSIYRRQIELMGGKALPRWLMQWWPCVPALAVGMLLGLLAPAEGREIIIGHTWVNRIVYGLVFWVVVSVIFCQGILPRRWYSMVYGSPMVISRELDLTTGLWKIRQIGRCPLPKLGFIASRQDVYRGGTRNAGILTSTPVLDATGHDLRDLKPADLWNLPPARGNYVGTNSRHARSLMEISDKAGLLYLEVHAKKDLLTGKNVALGLLLILACVAALNIMAGGGGLDVTQLRTQMGELG